MNIVPEDIDHKMKITSLECLPYELVREDWGSLKNTTDYHLLLLFPIINTWLESIHEGNTCSGGRRCRNQSQTYWNFLPPFWSRFNSGKGAMHAVGGEKTSLIQVSDGFCILQFWPFRKAFLSNTIMSWLF